MFLGGSWGIQAGSKRVPTYENLTKLSYVCILKAFMKNIKFKFFEIKFECRCECDHQKIEVRAQSACKTIFKVRVGCSWNTHLNNRNPRSEYVLTYIYEESKSNLTQFLLPAHYKQVTYLSSTNLTE